MAFDFPSSPTTGQTYSISGGPTYVYNGTAWVVLTPGNQFNRTVFTATAGQTTFSMNYVVGAIDVYRNGVKLAPADFTATNGTSIVLANGCTVGDTVEVISYPMITYSDAVKRTGDTMTGALAVPALTVNSVPVLAGPAFHAVANSTTSITSGYSDTLVVLGSEIFDVGGCFNNTSSTATLNGLSTPAYAFCPNVSGYYQINCGVTFTTASNNILLRPYKNTSFYYEGGMAASTPSFYTSGNTAFLVYLNGTGDYVRLYAISNAAATIGAVVSTYMSASLVRAA